MEVDRERAAPAWTIIPNLVKGASKLWRVVAPERDIGRRKIGVPTIG